MNTNRLPHADARRAPLVTRTRAVPALALVLLTLGCDEDPVTHRARELSCSIPLDEVLVGQRRDGIPSLSHPIMIGTGPPGSPRPELEDLVVGVVLGGEAVAVPLRILWNHEIVNLDVGGRRVAVTHCPLTGSSLVFDRDAVDGADFGVSGLLFRNNLMMFDRSDDEESLWPQMLRGARCGDRDGATLPMVPAREVTWSRWVYLYRDTRVVSEETFWDFDYGVYPYGDYAEEDNARLLFPLVGGIDPRRPPKERVLGVPDGSGGTVYPFGELEAAAGSRIAPAVATGVSSAGPHVVIWDGLGRGAMAFRPEAGGQPVTLRVVDGSIVDDETGSVWSVTGQAEEGPLTGMRLDAIPDAFVAFWFAWPAFYPQLEIWERP